VSVDKRISSFNITVVKVVYVEEKTELYRYVLPHNTLTLEFSVNNSV
jgi:hypothetical protein